MRFTINIFSAPALETVLFVFIEQAGGFPLPCSSTRAARMSLIAPYTFPSWHSRSISNDNPLHVAADSASPVTERSPAVPI